MSNTNELRLGLLPVITSYRQKKWITAAEECTFLKMISTSYHHHQASASAVTCYSSIEERVQQVKVKLDEIAIIATQKAKLDDDEENDGQNILYDTVSDAPSASATASAESYDNRNRKIIFNTPILNRHTRFPMTEYKKAMKYRKEENNVTADYLPSTSTLTSDIYDLAEDSLSSIMTTISQSKAKDNGIEEIFVGMMVFAKLGFSQPPCCLRCAHACSTGEGGEVDVSCENFVLWRKKANILIQPNSMKENMVIMKVSIVFDYII